MTLKFCSLASGSSGNCYLVKDDNSAILIDAGISGKKIFQGLETTGTPLDQVKAILVTHEHIDHVKSLPVVTKKNPNIKVYANEATWQNINRPVEQDCQRRFVTGETFTIGDFTIKSFGIHHDAAEPVGFSIYKETKQVSLCTDSGHISQDIAEELSRADILLIEANHEKEMLLFGSYPFHLKQRILGDLGHLSNMSCGEVLGGIIKSCEKKRKIILGHLSHENNTPEVAMQAVLNTLEDKGIFPGEDLEIEVARRDCCSRLYEL